MPLVLLGPSTRTLVLAVSTGLFKTAADFCIGEMLGSQMNPFCYLLAPLKDLLMGMAWFAPLASNTVVWRGGRYAIGRDSALSPYAEAETGMPAPDMREAGAK
ncbi:MAG: hypothetical protein M0Z58_02805 [Nitrospiraceae bacterium]|nr:hypothetical protein [Nitrospiraceae bacterium]